MPGKRTTPAQQRAIVAELAQNVPKAEIARRYNVCVDTIERVWRRTLRENPQSPLADPATGYRQTLERKAVTSVERGLDDSSDSYKSANIGVQVLKGLGVFAGDQQGAINVSLASVPAELMARYIDTTADEIRDTTPVPQR